MTELFNFDLLTVGIALALNLILGFLVLLGDTKSVTSRLFLAFIIVTAGWSIFNYLNYQVTDPVKILWYIRLVMFFAVLQVFSFFLLMYAFPKTQVNFPKWIEFGFVPIVFVVAFLTLTPLVFSGISPPEFTGDVAQPIPGPAIPLFGAVAISSVIGGIWMLLKKRRLAKNEEKLQFDYLLTGVMLMFSLIITFNFIFTVVFGNTRFIPLSAVFTLPFSLMVSYAVIRHHFLNAKVVSTAILIFVLSILTFFEVIISESINVVIFRSSIFLLILFVGVLLIRSVLREVEQRERLEILTKKLESANKQLKILDQARADFISIASHQLRTPPATIKWYLAAILDGDYGKFDDSVKEQLRKTMSTNNSMIALIDDLLNASRIERGKMEFVFEPTSMEEITQVTIDQLLPQAEMRKLQLIYNKPAEALPMINADKEKLRQVINNLIDNAIKYTQAGKVEVSLSKTAKEIVLKVSDSGRGIAKNQTKAIFEKYDRGKSPAKNSAGLGLGLYVAKVIVEQHKGKIWAESKGEGKGATFIVSLPVGAKLQKSEFDLSKDQK